MCMFYVDAPKHIKVLRLIKQKKYWKEIDSYVGGIVDQTNIYIYIYIWWKGKKYRIVTTGLHLNYNHIYMWINE